MKSLNYLLKMEYLRVIELLKTIYTNIIGEAVVALIVFLYIISHKKFKKIYRNIFSEYPIVLRKKDSFDLDYLLRSVRFSGLKIKEWHSEAAIIGLNRGGAIFAGLLAKFFNTNAFGIIEFSELQNPTLLLPKSFKRHISHVVLVDDRYNTGSTAEKGIRLIRKKFGDDVSIFYIVLIANKGKLIGDATGVGAEPLTGVTKHMVLFNPKRPEQDGEYYLPWDTKKYK